MNNYVWLLIAIVAVTTYILDKRFKKIENFIKLPSSFKKKPSPPSYKLDISISPNWYNILKKIQKPISKKELNEYLSAKEQDSDKDLWGRTYQFTEYYDSTEGQTIRLQRVCLANGKEHFYTVDEFEETGYLLNTNEKLKNDRELQNKLSIRITEKSICNNIFDPNLGGLKIFPEKSDFLYSFPVDEIFNFLLQIGQRFEGLETNTIIKWPTSIENSLKAAAIEYKAYFEHQAKIFDIEKEDKEFFEKIEKPQIALASEKEGWFESEEAIYKVKLKIFRPAENERIQLE